MNNTMAYQGYTASMAFDTDDKIIVGRVLDIDDIISFHGSSVAEFEAAFHAAVDGYIAACAQFGSAPIEALKPRPAAPAKPHAGACARPPACCGCPGPG